MGDLYGERTVFMVGLAVFTAQSLLLTAPVLALLMALFTSDSERAKAMGVYGFCVRAVLRSAC
jgi:hypothetical protein